MMRYVRSAVIQVWFFSPLQILPRLLIRTCESLSTGTQLWRLHRKEHLRRRPTRSRRRPMATSGLARVRAW